MHHQEYVPSDKHPSYIMGLYFLAALAGYSYIALYSFHPYPLSYLLKASPVLILALLTLLIKSPLLSSHRSTLYIVALLASASGDIFLDIDRTQYLKPALISFLFTQVIYIALFWPLRDLQTKGRWLIPLLCIVSTVLIVEFSSTAGALFIPVVIYTVCLTVMAISAVLVKNNLWINLGGVLFLCADAMIGINRFIASFDYSTHIIVTTYITAQLMIGWGLLFHPKTIPSQVKNL